MSHIRFSLPGTSLSFCATLLPNDNPDVCDLVKANLPLNTFLGHVVIAGQTFWMLMQFLLLKGTNMVEHTPSSVYCYAPGGCINVCYGKVTESENINEFAHVDTTDFESLSQIGQIIYQQTFSDGTKCIVSMRLELVDAPQKEAVLFKQPAKVGPSGTEVWSKLVQDINQATTSCWGEEPDKVRSVRLGVIESGSGMGGQSFSVLVHLKAYLMAYSADMLFHILKLAEDCTITTCQIKNTTLSLMVNSFNHFHFMGDLGLSSLNDLGTHYVNTLPSVTNKEEFIELTQALVIYINLLHHWIHAIFPWHLGSSFSHHTEAKVANEPKLAFYVEPSPV